jgi:bifunctional non-homologous end joining protein LigD
MEGFTKADVIRYYDAVADVMLSHLHDRPIIMERYPNGIASEYFLQKDAMPQHVDDWMLPYIHEVYAPEVKRTIRYIVPNERDVLLYLANYAAITIHPWSSRLQTLDNPDFVLFDLDPIETSFKTVQEVALALKAVLAEIGLRAYPKTSGGRGLHIYLPVKAKTIGHDEATIFAQAIASIVTERLPRQATVERAVKKRGRGKVYIDCLQNGRGKTLAAVYSLRARPKAPVSTPLSWRELKRPIEPAAFNIQTVPARLKRIGDLFKPVIDDPQDIAPFCAALRSRG